MSCSVNSLLVLLFEFDEHCKMNDARHQFAQECQPLPRNLGWKKVDSSQIATRSGKACHKAQPDRVLGNEKGNGDCSGRRLGRECGRRTECGDHCDAAVNQIGRQRRQPLKIVVGPAILDCHVLALDKPHLFQTFAECSHAICVTVGRCGVEKSDHRHHQLLRTCHERPCGRRATEYNDEFSPSHVAPRSGMEHRRLKRVL